MTQLRPGIKANAAVEQTAAVTSAAAAAFSLDF
jgi:hypothetical protein